MHDNVTTLSCFRGPFQRRKRCGGQGRPVAAGLTRRARPSALAVRNAKRPGQAPASTASSGPPGAGRGLDVGAGRGAAGRGGAGRRLPLGGSAVTPQSSASSAERRPPPPPLVSQNITLIGPTSYAVVQRAGHAVRVRERQGDVWVGRGHVLILASVGHLCAQSGPSPTVRGTTTIHGSLRCANRY